MTQGHALKLPDRRDAGAAENVQHLAVDHAAPFSRRTTRGDNMSHNASNSSNLHAATCVKDRKSVGVVDNSVQAQRSHSNTRAESSLAHRAALNRLNGVQSKKISADNASSASTQPVLVKSYSNPDQGKKTEMGKRRKPSVETSDLPPLASFSFQDILKEIDPEIQLSIDAIAEIYGRSKLSLADEYRSHRPPHGELDVLDSPDQADAIEGAQTSRLEPVKESTPGHSRRHSLALVGTSTQPRGGLSSNAVAATSNAMSVSQQRRQSASLPVSSAADTKIALLPYIMSWLRTSHARSESPSSQLSAEARAAESLQRILGDT